MKKLGELQHKLDADLEEMVSLTQSTLHDQPYTKAEIAKELETTPDVLDAVSLTANTKHIQRFKLKQRALHVFQGKRTNSIFAAQKNVPERALPESPI